MADLEFPRFEHHPNFESERVDNEAEREALFARWSAGQGKPKQVKRPTNLMPVRQPVATASSAQAAPVDPAKLTAPFMVYDVEQDANVPLTEDRLDGLLFAEEMMSILWPAAQRDQKAEATFPPEIAKAIGKVSTLIAARQAPAEPEFAAPDAEQRPRRGRPPKPKPAEDTKAA